MQTIKKPAPKSAGSNNTENYIMMNHLVSMLRESDGPMTRPELCSKMQIDDRAVRELVSMARLEGHPICSRSDRRGYWIGDEFDIARLVRDYRCRAKSLSKIADKLERSALESLDKECDGKQIAMWELDI